MKQVVLAMIPARMGSQRLEQKNLRALGGIPLITRAIRKCRAANVFDGVWVNSEHQAFGDIAAAEGGHFHQRPEALGSSHATSEQYIAEFLEQHPCDFVVQVHSIAPLISVEEIRCFVNALQSSALDCLMSVDRVQIECAYKDQPVNFSFAEKINSQNLEPVQRLSWSITAWRRSTYLAAVAAGRCATYAGRIGFHAVGSLAGHVIKTEQDLRIAEALLPLVERDRG